MYVLLNWFTKRPVEGLILLSAIAVGLQARYASNGPLSLMMVGQLILLGIIGLAARRLRRDGKKAQRSLDALRARNLQSATSTYERAVTRTNASPQSVGTMAEQNIEYKSLLLSFLSNHFPSGLRWEPLDMNPEDLACHLYIDLPESLPLPAHQLRFALSEYEAMMLKQLRAYDKPRTAGTAGENHQLLSLFVQTSDPTVLNPQ